MTPAQAASHGETSVADPRRGGTPVDAAPAGPKGVFRPDIEGLRAVAVLLVVLGHAGVAGLDGGYVGVDVFFVISGFLITGLLLREAAATGTVSLGRFYARRAVRLLPASSLVFVVTLGASWLWLSPVWAGRYAIDALATAFYATNIRLAISGNDYFAVTAPSPFQHFWSLAVEEQFYLLWPLLIIGTCLTLRRLTARRLRRSLVGVLAVLTVASFVVSVLELGRAVPWAYFGPHSRAWELGAGALVSLAANRLSRLSQWVAVVIGAAGLLAVLAAAVGYDEATAFPGVAAVLPVAGAAAVIAAGCAIPGGGVGRLLAVPPMQFLGRLSYGWYLWHWPALVIAPAALGVAAGIRLNLTLCAAALGLAMLTYHLVENPVRHRRALVDRPAGGMGLGLALSASTATLALIASGYPPAVPAGSGAAVDTSTVVTWSTDPQTALQRLILAADGITAIPANLRPDLAHAAVDENLAQRDGCHQTLNSTTSTASCVYGAGADARMTVVLFGDSHALQWYPALATRAAARGIRLVSLTRSSCSPADIMVTNDRLKRRYTACTDWRTAALNRIRKLRPQLVVVSSITNYEDSLVEGSGPPDVVWRDGWSRTLGALRLAADRVVVLGDTPFLSADPVECLLAAGRTVDECAEPRERVLRDAGWRAIVAREATRTGVSFVDPVPWLCAVRCPLIVGNVLVYRDSNHLTSSYARMLAPVLRSSLKLP